MKKVCISFLLLLVCVFVKGQASKQVADSNNLFAFQLYKHINKHGENLFFSPFSISAAMAMTYTGARNETAKQISHTLHFNSEAKHFMGGFKNMMEAIESDTLTDTANHIQLDMANSMWIADSLHIRPMYAELMQSIYHTEARKISFADSGARNTINKWVENRTNDKIKELISPGTVDASTKLVLVNALYFNAKWATAFSKHYTLREPFYVSKHDSVMAETMNMTQTFNYYEDKELQAIESPYKGEKLSMVVFLPKERTGINKMEKTLGYHYYNKVIDSMYRKKVKLALPKFNTTDQIDIRKVLEEMGVQNPFTAKADFSAMTDEPLYIDKIFHKAFIKVAEEGTEAASATAVTMSKSMVADPSTLAVFYANHPFIFVVKDNTTGCILFMGKITNPLK